MDIYKAKEVASKIRFSRDLLNSKPEVSLKINGLDFISDNYLMHSLLINKNTTPLLDKAINEVCETLYLPNETVSSFVTASSEINASCETISDKKCILNFF